ncbi:MAG: CynX/NimT family MFS transporter [Candidatus Binataceae bacterium]
MGTNEKSAAPAYRWVIEGLLIITLVAQVMTWLAPAPILGPMIKSLNISLGQAGLIISIIALCIGIFSFVGAMVTERLGTLRTLIVGVWLLGIGEILSGYTASFLPLLACRIIEGIGYGIIIGPPTTLVMQWFSEREWAYINTVNALCAYIGLTVVFTITAPVFYALYASWNTLMKVYGLSVVVVAILWLILGRERPVVLVAAPAHGARSASTLPEVLRMRAVILMAIALFGGMWVFQLYTAFLPEFFRVARGLSLSQSSNLTAVLPFTGVFAALAGGIGTAVVGLRRPFLWPLAILALIGCIGAILLPGIAAIRVSLVLVGIGAAGGLAAIGTLMMELPEMTPAKMGTAFSVVWAAGYTGAFISPFLGGALASAMGLRNVMLVFLALQLLPIVTMYLLPETGPGGKHVLAAVPVPEAAQR